MNISSNFDQNISRFHEILDVQKNFDIVYHTLTIADKKACCTSLTASQRTRSFCA